MCTKNGDHMLYCSWDIKAGLTEIFVILGHFLPFQPSNNSKNQHRMMYGLWDMERDRQNFLSYWAFFRYFAPLTNQKFKILKKMKKKAWRYNHFTQVYQKSWSYAILFLGYGAWRMWLLFFILGYILPFYPPSNPKNQNLKKKMTKMSRNIIILHMYSKNYDQMMYNSWNTVHNGRTDGRTDRWKKWHMEVGAPPKNDL